MGTGFESFWIKRDNFVAGKLPNTDPKRVLEIRYIQKEIRYSKREKGGMVRLR